MRDRDESAGGAPDDLLPASRGFGPLLQRDYWAVIDECRVSPRQVMALVSGRFPAFSPEDLCVFSRVDGADAPLEVGDELEVRIRAAGRFRVRVVNKDPNCLTLATLKGHPEAGRITFGAYRNERKDVIFHIRSRARSSSQVRYLGFFAVGEAMQTNTWTEFVNRVAVTVGQGVKGYIHAETYRMKGDEHRIEEALGGPTFLARGD